VLELSIVSLYLLKDAHFHPGCGVEEVGGGTTRGHQFVAGFHHLPGRICGTAHVAHLALADKIGEGAQCLFYWNECGRAFFF